MRKVDTREEHCRSEFCAWYESPHLCEVQIISSGGLPFSACLTEIDL